MELTEVFPGRRRNTKRKTECRTTQPTSGKSAPDCTSADCTSAIDRKRVHGRQCTSHKPVPSQRHRQCTHHSATATTIAQTPHKQQKPQTPQKPQNRKTPCKHCASTVKRKPPKAFQSSFFLLPRTRAPVLILTKVLCVFVHIHRGDSCKRGQSLGRRNGRGRELSGGKVHVCGCGCVW